MKLGLERSSQKPVMQKAEDHLFHLLDLLLWNPIANQSEQTLFVWARTCKQCQGEDAWRRVANANGK